MRVLFFVGLLTCFMTSQAAAGDSPSQAYATLLAAHVGEDGFVDYQALSRDPALLDAYVTSLAELDLTTMGREAQLAALINAYNAFTIKLIVENFADGNLKSITDLDGGKTWDVQRWQLAGKTVSLNHIEHEMIRPRFNEPRIHWALVCAAYSCPPLRCEPYTAEKLESQLAEQEARVLLKNDPRFIAVDDGRAKVTHLFEWYGGDFGDWQTYVNKRLADDGQNSLTFNGYIDYDWRLNSVSNRDR